MNITTTKNSAKTISVKKLMSLKNDADIGVLIFLDSHYPIGVLFGCLDSISTPSINDGSKSNIASQKI